MRGGSLLKSEIILKEEDMPLEKMTSFAYDKKNKKISLKTCPQVEYQVLSLDVYKRQVQLSDKRAILLQSE